MSIGKEIEATFLDIDKDRYRNTLERSGARLIQPEILMRRSVFDTGEHSFLRVRDEGGRIVMTYKNVKKLSLDGVDEVNVVVSNYENVITLLECAGLKLKARQETLRETWMLDGAEIAIDTWPALPAFTEIEGPSEECVRKIAEKLGFTMNDALYGSVDEIYHHYYGVSQEDVNYCPEIIFDKKPLFLNRIDLLI